MSLMQKFRSFEDDSNVSDASVNYSNSFSTSYLNCSLEIFGIFKVDLSVETTDEILEIIEKMALRGFRISCETRALII